MVAIFLIAIALAAINSATETRSVKWFLEHPAERLAMLQMCAQSQHPDDPECMNAAEASVRRLRVVP